IKGVSYSIGFFKYKEQRGGLSILLSKRFQKLRKFCRGFRREFHVFSSLRMIESDHFCMKRLASDVHRFPWSVLRISDKREADILHMDADLMGTACFQTTFNKREIAEAFKH